MRKRKKRKERKEKKKRRGICCRSIYSYVC
uniref:Ribosomal protein L22 n=1 Tax=Tetragonia tetragonoides TaxID=45318 RepID=A0A2K9VRX0_TETTT|nr:ribosomal protein L22 [Tetragonia tetragonoides]AUV65213.1 ribosomal protein L22 [Tetragonia tetragonoides]